MRAWTSEQQFGIMPRHITAVALGIIAGLILHLYILSTEGFLFSDLSAIGIISSIALGILLSYLILLVSEQLDRYFPWNSKAFLRLTAGILISFVLLFLTLGTYYYNFWSYQIIGGGEEIMNQQEFLMKLAFVVMTISFVFSAIYFALFTYEAYVHGRVKRVESKKQLIDAQLNALKSQLTPHFLFNSLNTISSLMYQDEKQAESFIRKLASTYQYTLNNYDKETISIEEELYLVRSYISMMQSRFGNNIVLKENLSREVKNLRILPLSLQTLIENAIKHNRIDDTEQLEIEISKQHQFLNISNNKTRVPQFRTSNKIGLSNLDRRYYFISGKGIKVSDQDHNFSVQIPLI